VFPRLASIATRCTSLARCQTDMIQSLSSGMQAQWYRHEVLANNLANVSTAGFKQDSLTLKQGTIEAGTGGTMAAGAHSIAQWTDF
jgi:flagellar basal body rod protein FlgG